MRRFCFHTARSEVFPSVTVYSTGTWRQTENSRGSLPARFCGFGHNAHALYWENLAPVNNGGGVLPGPDSPLVKAIDHYFGGIPKFIEEFNKVAADIQGSGWAWLAICPLTKALAIKSTEKHDSVKVCGWEPLLTVDVWEHAYYLQYKNLKAEYFKAIWRVINWRKVEERYLKLAL